QRAGRQAAGLVVGDVVHVRPGERVDGVVRRVGEAADAVKVVVGEPAELIGGVGSRRIFGVRRIGVAVVGQRQGVEVAPPFAHAAPFVPDQAGGVADQSVGKA